MHDVKFLTFCVLESGFQDVFLFLYDVSITFASPIWKLDKMTDLQECEGDRFFEESSRERELSKMGRPGGKG